MILGVFSSLNDSIILLILEEEKEAGNGKEINEVARGEERAGHEQEH